MSKTLALGAGCYWYVIFRTLFLSTIPNPSSLLGTLPLIVISYSVSCFIHLSPGALVRHFLNACYVLIFSWSSHEEQTSVSYHGRLPFIIIELISCCS